MQYYLDTNIIIFLITGDEDCLSNEVKNIIFDYSNVMVTSSVCVMEAIHIMQTKPKKGKVREINKIFDYLDELNISVKATTKNHLIALSEMPVLHTDPNDRLIIAQAASDKITLISSDLKFAQYAKKMKDFKFILNKR